MCREQFSLFKEPKNEQNSPHREETGKNTESIHLVLSKRQHQRKLVDQSLQKG